MDFYGETIGTQQFVRYIAMSVTEGCPLGGVPLYLAMIIKDMCPPIDNYNYDRSRFNDSAYFVLRI